MTYKYKVEYTIEVDIPARIDEDGDWAFSTPGDGVQYLYITSPSSGLSDVTVTEIQAPIYSWLLPG